MASEMDQLPLGLCRSGGQVAFQFQKLPSGEVPHAPDRMSVALAPLTMLPFSTAAAMGGGHFEDTVAEVFLRASPAAAIHAQ